MASLKQWLQTTAGRTIVMIAALGGIAVAGWQIKDVLGGSKMAAMSRDRWFVCSETLKPFTRELKAGMAMPIESPHSGKKTGYIAELCYWTADGKAKAEPTCVLLNESVGKPGPTFCPECSRLVVHHNPLAEPGVTPPPTKQEYGGKRLSRGPDRENQ